MAYQVFRPGLDGDIDAKIQRFKQHAGSPGVVDHDNRLWGNAAYGGNDCRNVVNFHGDRAGRLEEHHPGVWLNLAGDIGASQRIEPAGGDAELREDFSAKVLAGLIRGVGHQDMVALFNEGQNSIGNGCGAAGKQRAPGATFQFTHGFL